MSPPGTPGLPRLAAARYCCPPGREVQKRDLASAARAWNWGNPRQDIGFRPPVDLSQSRIMPWPRPQCCEAGFQRLIFAWNCGDC